MKRSGEVIIKSIRVKSNTGESFVLEKGSNIRVSDKGREVK